MSTVRTILQQKRLPLLNHFSRSALVNYCSDRRYGLELIRINAQSSFLDLVVRGRLMAFKSAESQDGISAALSEKDAQHILEIDTPYSGSQLVNRLLYTYNRSKASMDDYGEQVLYLGLGMLKSFNAGEGKGGVCAPLFLIPIELVRNGIHSPIVLKVAGGDPLLNPALRLVLAKDHGVELPGWDVYNDDGIETCLSRIEQAVQNKSGWKVERSNGCLDFFDLSPVLQYLDLDPQNQVGTDFESHPTVAPLLHQGFSPEEVLNDEGLSTDMLVEPGQIKQVVDANNEQLMVLFHAMNGTNLRVETGTGTGKTQTITNLVSDALAKKKRVLVVSNKATALEEAFSRLSRVGLDQFILPLFGKHLERKKLAEHLKKLQLKQPHEFPEGEVTLETLVRIRNKLNVYYNSIHTPIRDSGVTPYEAYTQLAELSAEMEGANLPSYDGTRFVLWKEVEFEAFLDEVKALQAQFERIGIASRHPFWGSKKTVYNAALKSEIQQFCRAAGMALQAVRSSSGEMAHQMGSRAPGNSDDIIRLIRTASRALEAPDLHGVAVYNEKWESSMGDLAALLDTGAKLSGIRTQFDGTLIPEAWTQDVLSIRQALVAHGSKKTRMLIGDYRKAKDKLAGLCREGIPKETADQLKLVNGILDVQRLQQKLDQHEELAKTLFGRQWQGIHSNWEHLDKVSSWLIKLHQEMEERQVIPELLDYLVQFPNLERLRKLAERVAKDFNTFLETSRHAAKEVGMHDALGMSKATFGRVPFGSLLSLFAHWEKHIDSLQDVVAFNHVAVRLTEKGMEDVVKIAVSWSESSKHLAGCIEAARYKALLTDVLKTRSTLSSFDEQGHEQTIGQYVGMDEAHVGEMVTDVCAAQAERFMQHRLPSKIYRAVTFELEEPPKRTLRELMTDAGKAVQDVKPIFLMTPESVSSLLTQSNVQFDIVVFDEAGRLSLTDSLGSVFRASQIVALGDVKQVGPRRFFDHVSIQNSQESSTTLDSESLMRVLKQRNATDLQLSWSFYSTAYPLLDYINRRDYGGRLIPFPNVATERVLRSVRFHDLSQSAQPRNGHAVRSLISELIDAAVKQMLRSPESSIGIVLQTIEEVEAVEWEFERRRRKDQALESLMRRGHPEPLFIKTLEQIQGQQCDILFVGLPFKNTIRAQSRTQPGIFHTAEEVRRQQAVLAAACRSTIHFFVDATTKELDQWAAHHAYLAEWSVLLEWVQKVAPHTSISKKPLAYQLALASALQDKGYNTLVQFGNEKMHLDLVVEHPEHKGQFILGIFGDGAPYKNAAIVRDRDRLYPAILKQKGWELYRLWSVEWFRNPHREIEKICAFIESTLTTKTEHDQFVPASVYSKATTNGSHPPIENDLSKS